MMNSTSATLSSSVSTTDPISCESSPKSSKELSEVSGEDMAEEMLSFSSLNGYQRWPEFFQG